MHSLKPATFLGQTEPVVSSIGTMAILENIDFALASLAIRSGKGKSAEAIAKKHFQAALPDVEKVSGKGDWRVIWTGQQQYLVSAPRSEREDIAAQLVEVFGNAASITEQTGGWVRFDVEGVDGVAMLERLCNVDAARMKSGDARRTVMEHLAVFLVCHKPKTSFCIYGASSSAASLHHALTTAASSL